MEHRIVLSTQEAFNIMEQLQITETGHVCDEYTGTERIRTNIDNSTNRKEYVTPVKGKIYRMYSKDNLGKYESVYLEFKWTKDTQKFEVEFEDGTPEEFSARENIKGWDILRI